MRKNLLRLSAALTIFALLLTLAACGEKPSSGERYPGEKSETYVVNTTSDPLLINLLGGSNAYFSCSVSLDITNQDDAAQLASKNHWIKDLIIDIGRHKTVEDMKASDAQEVYAQEILDALADQFKIASIFRVSFTSFYMYNV